MEDQPKIYILNREDFQKLYQQRSGDVKNVPTPVITMLGRKEGRIVVNVIAIDRTFLPEDGEKFLDCLVEHELSEVEFYLKNPEKYKTAVEGAKKGEPANPEAHLHALGNEMKRADHLGILGEYCDHWEKWLRTEMEKMTDEAAKAATEERLVWRKQALAKLKEEKERKREFRFR